MLRALSLLAEIGFAACLIVVALAVLTLRGHLRTALCWAGGMLLGLGMVVIIKRLMAGDPDLPHFPSGHVALAVTFYGGLALVLFRPELSPTPWRPLFCIVALVAIALAEGVSRVVLTEHGWMDVVGGFLVGVAGLVLAGNPWAWESIDRGNRLWVGGALLVAMPFAWLIHPTINPWIRHFAGV